MRPAKKPRPLSKPTKPPAWLAALSVVAMPTTAPLAVVAAARMGRAAMTVRAKVSAGAGRGGALFITFVLGLLWRGARPRERRWRTASSEMARTLATWGIDSFWR